MTTDPKPLPERFDCTNGNTPWCQGCYTMTPDECGDYVQWEDYERIAAAKDAEIERLRAEVEAVWAAMPRDARYLDPPDGGCVPLHEQVRRMAADATRAERLEAALRELLIDMKQAQSNMKAATQRDPRWEGCAEAIQPRVAAAEAALHEHEQETQSEQ